MGHLNIEKLRAAKLETDPFEHTIVPAFLSRETVRSINCGSGSLCGLSERV